MLDQCAFIDPLHRNKSSAISGFYYETDLKVNAQKITYELYVYKTLWLAGCHLLFQNIFHLHIHTHVA